MATTSQPGATGDNNSDSPSDAAQSTEVKTLLQILRAQDDLLAHISSMPPEVKNRIDAGRVAAFQGDIKGERELTEHQLAETSKGNGDLEEIHEFVRDAIDNINRQQEFLKEIFEGTEHQLNASPLANPFPDRNSFITDSHTPEYEDEVRVTAAQPAIIKASPYLREIATLHEILGAQDDLLAHIRTMPAAMKTTIDGDRVAAFEGDIKGQREETKRQIAEIGKGNGDLEDIHDFIRDAIDDVTTQQGFLREIFQNTNHKLNVTPLIDPFSNSNSDEQDAPSQENVDEAVEEIAEHDATLPVLQWRNAIRAQIEQEEPAIGNEPVDLLIVPDEIRDDYWEELKAIAPIVGASQNRLRDDFRKAYVELWDSFETGNKPDETLGDELQQEYIRSNGVHLPGKMLPIEFVQSKRADISSRAKAASKESSSQRSSSDEQSTSSHWIDADDNTSELFASIQQYRKDVLSEFSKLSEQDRRSIAAAGLNVTSIENAIKDSQANTEIVQRFIGQEKAPDFAFTNAQLDSLFHQHKNLTAALKVVGKNPPPLPLDLSTILSRDLITRLAQADRNFLPTVRMLSGVEANVFTYLHNIVVADSAVPSSPSADQKEYTTPSAIKGQVPRDGKDSPSGNPKFRTTKAQGNENFTGKFISFANNGAYVQINKADSVSDGKRRLGKQRDTVNLKMVQLAPKSVIAETRKKYEEKGRFKQLTRASKETIKRRFGNLKTLVNATPTPPPPIPMLHTFPLIQRGDQVRVVMNVPYAEGRETRRVMINQQTVDALHANAPQLSELHSVISNKVLSEHLRAIQERADREMRDERKFNQLQTDVRQDHEDALAKHEGLVKQGIRPLGEPAPEEVTPAHLLQLRNWDQNKERPVLGKGKGTETRGFVKVGGRYLGDNPDLMPPTSTPQTTPLKDAQEEPQSSKTQRTEPERTQKLQALRKDYWENTLPGEFDKNPDVSEEEILRKHLFRTYTSVRESQGLPHNTSLYKELADKYVAENGSGRNKGKLSPVDFIDQHFQYIVDETQKREAEKARKTSRPASPKKSQSANDNESIRSGKAGRGGSR